MHDWDVAVIGAGAAGLAATRTLRERGLDARVIEARNRIGGRAWTDSERFGFPVDRGCHWLHSADVNPLRAVARELGLTVIEEDPDWSARSLRHGWSAARAAELNAAHESWFDAIERAGADGRDVALLDLLPADHFARPSFDAIMTWISGAEVAEVATLDYARYRDTHRNWPVAEGLGTLVAKYGATVPAVLDAPVTRVDWSGRGVTVESAAGSVRARAAIVTQPPSVLAAETIAFVPALPAAKQAACHGIAMGIANKVDFRVAEAERVLPEHVHTMGSLTTSRTGSLAVRPYGRPQVMAYYGGDLARDLEAAGAAAMIDFATEELVALFGAAVRGHLVDAMATAWAGDPWARGAYSHAGVGQADRRVELAAPLDERLFFAGEATSVDSYSTLHGAYLSGLRAADEVAAALAGACT